MRLQSSKLSEIRIIYLYLSAHVRVMLFIMWWASAGHHPILHRHVHLGNPRLTATFHPVIYLTSTTTLNKDQKCTRCTAPVPSEPYTPFNASSTPFARQHRVYVSLGRAISLFMAKTAMLTFVNAQALNLVSQGIWSSIRESYFSIGWGWTTAKFMLSDIIQVRFITYWGRLVQALRMPCNLYVVRGYATISDTGNRGI